ncbi:MAG: hypothetical protein HPY66_2177 [Firmicutes bacterium]|nr:hypothetical protein [Bacillota bacterium]
MIDVNLERWKKSRKKIINSKRSNNQDNKSKDFSRVTN